jgi:sensor domain CHASE-containing protein
VQKLDDEQIADIRQRLNVDVEVLEGQPPAAAPIESFIDMVRSSSSKHASADHVVLLTVMPV